jgi:hypothetical protein
MKHVRRQHGAELQRENESARLLVGPLDQHVRWMHKEPVAICSCLRSMENKLRLGRGMRTEEEGSLGQRGSWIDREVGMTRASAGSACVWW